MSRYRRARKQAKLSQNHERTAIYGKPSPQLFREDAIAPLAACTIASLGFLRSLTFGFIHDDHSQILANPQVQSWSYFFRLLSSDTWSQKGIEHVGYYYRPIFSVWLLLVHTLGGVAPWAWHISSIVLHAFATWLVFKLSLVLLEDTSGALWAAMLFAIHPIHIESVAWISASVEIL